MCRVDNAKLYFRNAIDKLVDDAYAPGAENKTLLFAQVERYMGALSYAKEMGDIDTDYYRVYYDMLAGVRPTL